MTKGTVGKNLLNTDLSFGHVSLIQKMLFARHLAVMLKSGIAISDALRLIYGSSQGRFKEIIAEIYTSVKSGASLANALAHYPHVFSGFFHGSVLAGEASGNLSTNLENIAKQLKKDKELLDKIKAALFYPVIVLAASAVITVFIAFYILPKVTPLLSGLRVQLPWTTKLLIYIASVAQSYGFYLLISLVAIIILLFLAMRQRWAEAWFGACSLNMPLVGKLIHYVNLSRFSLNLGILLKSGLAITDALKLTADSLTNYHYREVINSVNKAVNKGTKLATALNNYPDYFPDIAVRMIKVGEESGHLEESLFYIAEFYETELDGATKNLTVAIEPALLIIIGLVVGFLAIAIITPIYSITGSISR